MYTNKLLFLSVFNLRHGVHFFIRTSKFKLRLTFLNVFENARLNCSKYKQCNCLRFRSMEVLRPHLPTK